MATEAEEPGLRVVVLGDFGGAGAGRVAVDRESFDAAIAALEPRLALRVPDRLGGADLDVELRFAAWRDLTPEGVCEQVPALRGLTSARAILERHRKGEIDAAAATEALAGEVSSAVADALAQALGAAPEPPAASAPASAEGSAGDAATGSVDSILDMVDAAPEAGRDSARSLVDSLTPRARARTSGRQKTGADAALAAVDALLSAQLDEIVGSAAFQRLESSWRGLRFLVRRTDFRAPIAMELVSAEPDAAADAVRAIGEGDDPDVVLADYEFDASARDLARVEALAEAALEIQTPVVTGVAPGFLGLDSWAELARARAPYAVFDEPAYADWRSFRGDERSRWVTLVANRLVLRGAYGPDGEKARGVAYRASASAGLMGSGVWALGCALVRAYARTGACVQMSGTRNGLVDDLALAPSPPPDGKPAPVEGLFGNDRREDLERVGLVAVQHYQRDIAFVGAARTFRQPERYADAEATADAAQQTMLPYQLFASRFVKFVGRTVPELVGTGGRDEATTGLRDAVVRFLSTEQNPLRPDHVGVGMSDNESDARLTDVSLRVQPELQIGGRPVNVLLNFSVPL